MIFSGKYIWIIRERNIIFMIRSLVLLLACMAIRGNLVNYKFQLESTLPLIPDLLKNASIAVFYLPTLDTVIMRSSNRVIVVNNIQPGLYIEYPAPAQSVFFYGRQLSLIATSSSTQVIKSYQYPQKHILNTLNLNPKSTNCLIWINQTTALAAVGSADNQYIGVYTASSDTLTYKYLSIYNRFKGIVKLLGNDALLITKSMVYKFDLFTLEKSVIVDNYTIDFQLQCFKTFSVKDEANNKIYEHIVFKQDHLLRKFTRELQLNNGNIVNKTGFAFVNSFVDTSYNCSFDFLDAKQLILANQTASVIYRGIDIEDLFVGSRSSKLISNSIPVRGSPASFIKDGVLQTIQPNTLETTSRKINMTLQNELKAWETQFQQLIIFNKEQKVEIQKGVDGTSSTLTGILDCELIREYLFLLRPVTSSKIELVVYEISSKLERSRLSIDNSTISEIKLEGVKIEGRPICMLSYREISDNVVNQFWDFEQGVGLRKAIADTHTPYNKILIPTATTYYLVEDKGEIRTTISFYSLTDNTPKLSIRDVLNYKWLRVQETALVVYFGNERKECIVYTFKIDLQANTVTIMNQTFIQLDKMTDDITNSSIFFLPDIRTYHQPNNYLIYFYSSSDSYFYNTLDPVFHYSKISRFSYNTLQQPLLINPQFNHQNLYYALSNFTFVQITYSAVPQPQVSTSCDFTAIFSRCRSVRMKIVNQASRTVIQFLCNTNLNSIIYIFDASSIMACNVHNKINRLIYPLGVLDFDTNSLNDVVVAHVNNNDEYFDYYKGNPTQILPISSKNILCLSDNGYFLGYLSGNQFVIANLLTKKYYESLISVSQTTKCSIDNSGTWFIVYSINDYQFTIRNQDIQYKKISLKHSVSKIEFVGQGLLIYSTSDVYYYDSIFKNNVKYFVRDQSSQQVTSISHSEDYIVITSSKGMSDAQITVCELNGICFSPFRVPYQHFSQQVRNDGKVVFYQDADRSLHLWSNQLKECDGGTFISNGECSYCSSDCASCEAETGACLDCVPQCSSTALILVSVFTGLTIIVLFYCLIRLKRRMRLSSLLSDDPLQDVRPQ